MTNSPITLHARVDGTGPDVVLLHGLFGSAENLGGIARRLREHFRVHALDMRNHGRSAHTATHSYADLAGDVEHYIASLDLNRVHLVGHSMGGKAVMRLVLDAPARIASASVIDIAPKAYPRHHDAILLALQALEADPPSDRRAADARLSAQVAEPAVRQFLLKNLQRTGEQFSLKINLDTLVTHYDEIAAWDAGAAPSAVPVLFIVGGDSDYVSDADRASILQQFPKAIARVVSGGSHWVHAEKPDLVANLIQRHVQQHIPT